jgi:hypothetical protein
MAAWGEAPGIVPIDERGLKARTIGIREAASADQTYESGTSNETSCDWKPLVL